MRRLTLALVLFASVASAQPQSQPLLQSADIAHVGSFTLPATDGSNRGDPADRLIFGGTALAPGTNGTLWFGCKGWGVARVTIPASGQAAIVERCESVPALGAVDPGEVNGVRPGGALWWNNRLIVSGFSIYDASSNAVASHFAGANVLGLTGPAKVGTLNPGTVGGSMTPIPSEWRALMGGPALTGLCCISIVSRSSAGPTATVFDPDALQPGVTQIPGTRVLGYGVGQLAPFEGPGSANELYNALTAVRGIAWPSGFRTVMFVGRHGLATDPRLPVPGQVCYGSDATCGVGGGYSGFHGPPYRLQAWLYDANDLLAVKQGAKTAGEVRPYATVALPGSFPTSHVSGATYDDATRTLYVALDTYVVGCCDYTVRVEKFSIASPASLCQGTWAETVTLAPAVCDATQVQTRTVTRTFTQTSGDVASCPASPMVVTTTEACVYVPPPPTGTITIKSLRPKSCDIRVTSTPPDATGGWGVQFTLNGSNMGSRDTSSPYQRDKSNVPTGTIAAGVWSKNSDVRPFTIGAVMCEE